MTHKTYRLPPAFWYDHHVNRGCSQSATVIRETRSFVEVSLDETAYADLSSDVDFTIGQYRAGSFHDQGSTSMGGLYRSALATRKRLDADPLLAPEPEMPRRRFVFENPGDGYPRTISADATSEEQARRIIRADLPITADWPLAKGERHS